MFRRWNVGHFDSGFFVYIQKLGLNKIQLTHGNDFKVYTRRINANVKITATNTSAVLALNF